MAKYVMLGTFTEQGIKSAKDTVKRARAVRELAALAPLLPSAVQNRFDLLLAARSRLGVRRLQHNKENGPQQNDDFFHHVPIVRRTKQILKSQPARDRDEDGGGDRRPRT